jgi:hypothetical protein
MKNLFSFVFFIGSARPPEMIQSSSVGRAPQRTSIPYNLFAGSARPPFDPISPNPWWNCISTKSIQNTFVDCSA